MRKHPGMMGIAETRMREFSPKSNLDALADQVLAVSLASKAASAYLPAGKGQPEKVVAIDFVRRLAKAYRVITVNQASAERGGSFYRLVKICLAAGGTVVSDPHKLIVKALVY